MQIEGHHRDKFNRLECIIFCLQKGTIAFDYQDRKYGIRYSEREYIDKNNV